MGFFHGFKHNIRPVAITNINNLPEHYGEFVRLELDRLHNARIRYNDMEYLKDTEELHYQTIRRTYRFYAFSDDPDLGRKVDEKRIVYGILRKEPHGEYILNHAFVEMTDARSEEIQEALDRSPEFEYYILEDGGISIFNFVKKGSANLIIPDTLYGRPVEEISFGAFEYNELIRSVRIPDSVRLIGRKAFQGCQSLEKAFTGDGVSKIEFGAFTGCRNLKEIHIGRNVDEIQRGALACSDRFEVDPDNAYFCSADGILYTKDMSSLVSIPSCMTSEDEAGSSSDDKNIKTENEVLEDYARIISRQKNCSLAYAMKLIGDYYKSEGQDLVIAARWYKRAADGGDPDGMRFYADMLLYGQGVVKNPQEAIRYYVMAAEKGQKEAQYIAGQYYETAGDQEKAAKYYNMAKGEKNVLRESGSMDN